LKKKEHRLAAPHTLKELNASKTSDGILLSMYWFHAESLSISSRDEGTSKSA
jgi:hypothetical protein